MHLWKKIAIFRPREHMLPARPVSAIDNTTVSWRSVGK